MQSLINVKNLNLDKTFTKIKNVKPTGRNNKNTWKKASYILKPIRLKIKNSLRDWTTVDYGLWNAWHIDVDFKSSL